jgi:hypothetical protein
MADVRRMLRRHTGSVVHQLVASFDGLVTARIGIGEHEVDTGPGSGWCITTTSAVACHPGMSAPESLVGGGQLLRCVHPSRTRVVVSY